MNFDLHENNTFCISLESKVDRWEKMTKRFDKAGLKVSRWLASCRPDEMTENYVYYLSLGQKGCAQSHINLWRHLLNSPYEYYFILEDDACFDINWREKLDSIWNDIQDSEWDAIFLNASEPIEQTYQWIRCYEQYLTAGYIISKRGAQKLLEQFKDCFYASDWMTSRLQYYHHCYSYFPWLIIQEGNESTISTTNGHIEDHKKVVRCLEKINYSIENYDV